MRRCRALAVAAGVAAVVAGSGMPAAAGPAAPDGVVLLRTDEPEVLEGLRVQFCTTGTPPTQKVTAEVLWPNETPGGDCAVVAVPSPDETGSSAAARFVDDRGAQELDAEAPKAACVVKDVDILTIYIPEAADPPGCNLVS